MNILNMIFDKAAEGLSALEKMKLIRSLNMVRTDIATVGEGALAALKKLKLISSLNQIRLQLGAGKNSKTNQPPALSEVAQQATDLIAKPKEPEHVDETLALTWAYLHALSLSAVKPLIRRIQGKPCAEAKVFFEAARASAGGR